MRNGLRSLFGLLAAAALASCADLSSRVRRYTYPPEFNYISEAQLRSAMWRLAAGVRELDHLARVPKPIDEPRRNDILKLLVSMERATEELGKEGRPSNHPIIDDHLSILRGDIDLARKQVESEPPSYVLVALLPGACMYCHSRGR